MVFSVIKRVTFVVILCGGMVGGLHASPAYATQAKASTVETLLDVMGTKQQMAVQMDLLMQQLLPLLRRAMPADINPAVLDLLDQEFMHVMQNNMYSEVVAVAIPVYQREFSEEELGDVIAFYQSPVGRKMATKAPQMMQELAQALAPIGQKLGTEAMQRAIKKAKSQGIALKQ